MTQITTDELKSKIENKETFVLDLFATWCGPCRILMSGLEKLEKQMVQESSIPKFDIYKYDIDTDRDFVVNELGIRSVPTIKFFKDGVEVDSKVGVIPNHEVIKIMS